LLSDYRHFCGGRVKLPNQPPKSVIITISSDLTSPTAGGTIEFYPPEIANLFMDLGIF
jgi:hypothetical protein